MLKNIYKKLRSKYRQNLEDTTKEWEEVGEEREITQSKYSILINSSLKNRIIFLFTNKLVYRLTHHQFVIIHKNPLYEKN